MPKKDQIKINFRLQAGFTLIEMIVAMAIFGVLAVSITGIFISVIKSQRLALAQNSIQESGRYILESMTKEIRMSQEITELGVSSALHLINSDRKDVLYSFGSAVLSRQEEGFAPPENLNSSANEKITGYFFVQKNAYSSVSLVTIILQIKNSGPEFSEKPFVNLQTTIATRN